MSHGLCSLVAREFVPALAAAGHDDSGPVQPQIFEIRSRRDGVLIPGQERARLDRTPLGMAVESSRRSNQLRVSPIDERHTPFGRSSNPAGVVLSAYNWIGAQPNVGANPGFGA